MNQSSESSLPFSRRDFLAVSGLSVAASLSGAATSAAPSGEGTGASNDGKLRIICFGAHPDDCEIAAGGSAAKWAASGHHVKLVARTNGDIGHWALAGGPLALRR